MTWADAQFAKPRRVARGDMLALLRSFPALESCPLQAWDPVLFDQWVHEAGLSSGAWHAALFVAAVWNPRFARVMEHKCGGEIDRLRGFDLFAAMRVWDNQQIAAFAAWAEAPWTA